MTQLNPRARLLLLAAVLILLSETIAEEGKRCYWCGPLAEQVHRSQRAPSCNLELQETMCEKGFTHCAVIATSPPYAESRMCVKLYQDECYSLYCNSSKTWRMICPCQGDLCNGRNTDRETKAFSTLRKEGKNKRNKRSLSAGLSPEKQITKETYTTIIVIPDNGTTEIAMQSDQPMEELTEIIHQSTAVMSDTDVPYDNNEGNVEENTIKYDSDANEMQADQPLEEQKETNEYAATDDERTVEETKKAEHSKITRTIDEIKTSITPAMTMPNEMKNDDEKLTAITIPAEFVKETHTKTTELPITSMKPSSIEIELSVVQIKNPKDDLPPPEALQQNDTPPKDSVPTTMVTTETSTNIIETTTHSMKDIMKKNKESNTTKKNDGTKNANSLFALFIIVCWHYTYIVAM